MKSLKEHPEILKELEGESDEKTKALLKMIFQQIQDDPEYSSVNH